MGLDLQVAHFSNPEEGGKSFSEYSEGLHKLCVAQEDLENVEQKKQTFQELLTHLLLTVNDYGDNPVVKNVIENSKKVDEELDELVRTNAEQYTT